MTVIDRSRNDLETLDLGVEGMTCASCVAHVERAIAAGIDDCLETLGGRSQDQRVVDDTRRAAVEVGLVLNVTIGRLVS